LVEGFARTDQDHRAVLGVLADRASRVAPSFLALAATDQVSFSGMSLLGGSHQRTLGHSTETSAFAL
jgi:hypothetical protein